MTLRYIFASAILLASAIALSSPVSAAGAAVDAATGHYEWRYISPLGPKGLATGPMRVWVGPKVNPAAQMASCDCTMMRHTLADAAACMKSMGTEPADAAPTHG
jgi:hypothetical protein